MTSTLSELARLRALATPTRRTPSCSHRVRLTSGRAVQPPDVQPRVVPAPGVQIAQRNPMVRQMLQYVFVRPPRRYVGAYFDMT